jgi:hypothetical protein
MTQAFNLSQLANNLNTSGQLDATDGLTGAVPVANGGTGLTATPSNGQIDIGNGSGFSRTTITAGSGISVTNGSGTITIATSGGGGVTSLNGQTGAITNTTGGSIGSYFIGFFLSGGSSSFNIGSTTAGSNLRVFDISETGSSFTIRTAGRVTSPSYSGTWRCASPFRQGGSDTNQYEPSLWVRIS